MFTHLKVKQTNSCRVVSEVIGIKGGSDYFQTPSCFHLNVLNTNIKSQCSITMKFQAQEEGEEKLVWSQGWRIPRWISRLLYIIVSSCSSTALLLWRTSCEYQVVSFILQYYHCFSLSSNIYFEIYSKSWQSLICPKSIKYSILVYAVRCLHNKKEKKMNVFSSIVLM